MKQKIHSFGPNIQVAVMVNEKGCRSSPRKDVHVIELEHVRSLERAKYTHF
jgi:hypothetical protein